MGKWIPLSAGKLLESKRERVDGVLTQLATSPLDFPVAFLAERVPGTAEYRIAFRYLVDDTEHCRTQRVGPVSITVGRDSGRVVEVRVPVSAVDGTSDGDRPTRSLEAILRALSDVEDSKPTHKGTWWTVRPIRKESARLTRKVIEDDEARLFSLWSEGAPLAVPG
jgi:hypothetical protein